MSPAVFENAYIAFAVKPAYVGVVYLTALSVR
jgi:hypothetical protein